MQPETLGLLWDARRATGFIGEFVADRTWQDYQGDAMLRSAVERQFQIIGEALRSSAASTPPRQRGYRICHASWPSATCSSMDMP
jgi:uncharacterized protein with HEPN domain